jgi:RNA recognition motif-containing protein
LSLQSVIIKDQRTGESRGFAFVEFREREACLHAIKHLNGIEFQGQKLSVVLAKPSQSTEKKPTTHRGNTPSSCMKFFSPCLCLLLHLTNLCLFFLTGNIVAHRNESGGKRFHSLMAIVRHN